MPDPLPGRTRTGVEPADDGFAQAAGAKLVVKVLPGPGMMRLRIGVRNPQSGELGQRVGRRERRGAREADRSGQRDVDGEVPRHDLPTRLSHGRKESDAWVMAKLNDASTVTVMVERSTWPVIGLAWLIANVVEAIGRPNRLIDFDAGGSVRLPTRSPVARSPCRRRAGGHDDVKAEALEVGGGVDIPVERDGSRGGRWRSEARRSDQHGGQEGETSARWPAEWYESCRMFSLVFRPCRRLRRVAPSHGE